MGKNLNSFEIVLDRPQPVYKPGEEVTGQCVVILETQMSMVQLSIELKGKAKCQWEGDYDFTWIDEKGIIQFQTEPRSRHSNHQCVNLNCIPGFF